jgi:hypothetical protein
MGGFNRVGGSHGFNECLKWTEVDRFGPEFLAQRYPVPTDQLIYLVKKRIN